MQRDWTAKTHASSYDFISPLHLDLSGRHILITGAAYDDGVGFATATAYARAGSSVIALVDLNGVAEGSAEKLVRAALDAGRSKPQIISAKADISSLAEVEAALSSFAPVLASRLDVLVNNAAHMEPFTSILDADPKTYWRTWEVNVRGLFNVTRVFLPMLLSTSGGLNTVLNVASSGALSVRKNSSGYRSSKLAVLRLTESLAVDHGEQGLLAYAVNPGAIKTQITVNTPEEIRNRLPHTPDIAGDTIVWLTSERRDWLAGRYVSCPWDMGELLSRKEEVIQGDKLKVRMVF